MIRAREVPVQLERSNIWRLRDDERKLPADHGSGSQRPLAVTENCTLSLHERLAFMWSAIFSVWTGWINMFGPSAIGHMILLVGVFFTVDVFRHVQQSVRQPHPVHHRDAMRNKSDGTALYDDLWGAP
jgi:hypothetical protein